MNGIRVHSKGDPDMVRKTHDAVASTQGGSGTAEWFVFRGELVRHEDGAVAVRASSAEEAVARLEDGEWEEWASYSGNTEFEWDGQAPGPA